MTASTTTKKFRSQEWFDNPDNPGMTVLTYAAKADVGGKIAQLGSRLITSTSKKLAGEFFSTFNEQVSGT